MRAEDLLSKFGEHLRALRRARGWTQQQLATGSGLSVDGIRRIEAGGFAPSLTTLDKLSRALRVPLGRLVGGTEGARSPEVTPDVTQISEFLATLPGPQLEIAARMLYGLRSKKTGGPTSRKRTATRGPSRSR